MTAFLEQLAKIPLPRLVVGALLALVLLAAIEQLEFTQEMLRHILNMEAR